MAAAPYLTSAEATALGMSGVTDAMITQASMLLDTYLCRPEGLLYQVGANGAPLCMARMDAMFALTVPGTISPGTNVQVTVTGPASMVQPGTPLVLDRATSNAAETVVVAAVSGQVVTLASVTYAHAAGTILEAGLFIMEERSMPKGRPVTVVAQSPVMAIVAAQGRYGYARRGQATNFPVDDFNLLAALSHFGGPPAWETIAVNATGVQPRTGEIWVPAGVMLAYYSDVRLHYIAGYATSSVPSAIKQAVISAMQAVQSSPLNGNVRKMQAGDTAIERFTDTVFDADTKALLAPYRARVFA